MHSSHCENSVQQTNLMIYKNATKKLFIYFAIFPFVFFANAEVAAGKNGQAFNMAARLNIEKYQRILIGCSTTNFNLLLTI
ncbi:MAG TPA: hypothetical protein DIW64_12890 [Cellvibrio sp.]|nr:hypothetical protein [Cellvibrio sp.]